MRAIAVLALLVACSDPGATSIRLGVDMPEAAGIDELAIIVASQRTLAPASEELTVFVPDDWAGAPIRLEVEGMARAMVVALGATDVMPIRGEEISALVQLVDAACPTVCTPGDTRCEGDGIATCVMMGSCPAWSAADACDASTPFCSNGTCAATCSDECGASALACDGTASARSCGNGDADPCLDWITTACDSDEHCESGMCEPDDTGPTCAASFCMSTFTATTGISAMTHDATHIYWLETDGVMRKNEATGAVQTVQPRTINTDAYAIAVDDTYVYWTEGNGTIKRAPKNGTGSLGTVLGDPTKDIAYFVIDDAYVYWAEYNTKKIYRKLKAGGTHELVSTTARCDVGGRSHRDQ